MTSLHDTIEIAIICFSALHKGKVATNKAVITSTNSEKSMTAGHHGRMLWPIVHQRCRYGGRKNLEREGSQFNQEDELFVVIKQMSKTCYCGLPMEFPDGEIRTKCLCGALWILGQEGYLV
ncbi:hypothetical protein [Desulfosporosinus sp. SB140]|uniref:hypothetical protein n=1 Tax=Desulfosporosinus paludis TaxID=3115649 RepID=UPI00388E3F1A